MSEGINQTDQIRDGKRAQFTEPEPKSKTGVIVVVAVAALAAAAAYFILGGSADRPATIGPPTQAASNPGEIRVPLKELSSKAKFFDYKTADSSAVRFFVVKSPDGGYRAALDACEVCAHAKLGYRQEGTEMVCKNCEKRFDVNLIGTINSGCHPVGLRATRDGEDLVIRTSELETGRKFF